MIAFDIKCLSTLYNNFLINLPKKYLYFQIKIELNSLKNFLKTGKNKIN